MWYHGGAQKTKQNKTQTKYYYLFLESLNLVLKSKTPSSSCRSLSVIARDSCISEFSPELNFRGKIGGFGKWGVEQQIFEGQYGEGFLMHCGGHYAVQLFFYLSIFLQEGLKLSLDHLCPRYFIAFSRSLFSSCLLCWKICMKTHLISIY